METRKLLLVFALFAFVLFQETLGKSDKRLKRKNQEADLDANKSHELSQPSQDVGSLKHSEKTGVVPAAPSPAGSADADEAFDKKGRKGHRTKHRRPHHKRKHSRGGHKGRRVKESEGEENHELQTAGVGVTDVKQTPQRGRGHKNPEKYHQRQQRRLQRKKARANRKKPEESHDETSSNL